MNGYAISERGLADIGAIVDYIAADNPEAARRVRDRLFTAFAMLAIQPGLGHGRPDLVALEIGLQVWPVGSYLVFYRQNPNQLQIARVLHANRDIASIMTIR